MRGSEPMPWRTCSTSAPTRSAMLAISFMNEILVASIALAAYLAAHHRHRLFAGRTDDDAIRAHAVGDRVAFLQEFRIGHHVEGDVRATCGQFLGDGGTHLVGRADRHRRLVDHHGRHTHVPADGTGHGQHVLQVRAAILVRRRAHRDEHHLAMLDGGRGIGGERQPRRGMVGLHHRLQARLIDRDDAPVEAIDLALD
ncbi:hypothetical protein G6F22_018450 [Rhizopus arrhizus]|nr:hypothetical protein G6F22_018450 [Rhizopus arrhizus]